MYVWCVSMLCERKLYVRKLCVNKLFVGKLCMEVVCE